MAGCGADGGAGRLHSPSVARNAAPIVEAFGEAMAGSGLVLEVASGTGQHAAALCEAYPALRWQPSDPDPSARASAASWAETVPDGRVLAPLDLDVRSERWWQGLPESPSAIVCINMIHIAPWTAAEGLFAGAGALLQPEERLLLYGPFSRRGRMARSNAQFSASLRARDPAFGVRDLDDHVQPLAARFGLFLLDVRQMPANNLTVVFEKL